MFENIGEKIKNLAKVVSILGIASSVIYGITVMFAGGSAVVYGLLIMIAGTVIAWISSFFTYGFGELIVNTKEIKDGVRNIASNNAEYHNNHKHTVNPVEKKENSFVSSENVEITCPKCNAGLSYSENFLKGKTHIECPLCKNDIDLNK